MGAQCGAAAAAVHPGRCAGRAWTTLPGMDAEAMEIRDGVVHTFDGEAKQVEGGVYLSPAGYLAQANELASLRAYKDETESIRWPVVVVGAALAGLAVGFWLGNRRREDDD